MASTLALDYVTDLADALRELATTHAATVMPGRTHGQHAQPVTFGHHLLAYAEMFMRDISRLADARDLAQARLQQPQQLDLMPVDLFLAPLLDPIQSC